MNNLLLQENQGVSFLVANAFAETGLVKHGFSTRIGGVSKEPFGSLNLGFHTGDDFEAVQKNRIKFARAVGIPVESMVAANQVHGEGICVVDKSHRGRGALDQATVVEATDSLMTNVPGVPLIAFFADCVPLMFLDTRKKAIAIAHAGWKGTVLKIGAKTVEKMGKIYGSKPEDILAVIGPSIGACHYEVDQPVIQAFQDAFPQWQKFVTIKDSTKAQLDLWEANRLQLVEQGLKPAKITVANICTYCHHELLYSYRYNSGKTGRLAGVIMLQEE